MLGCQAVPLRGEVRLLEEDGELVESAEDPATVRDADGGDDVGKERTRNSVDAVRSSPCEAGALKTTVERRSRTSVCGGGASSECA